jgi:hypothetical protein
VDAAIKNCAETLLQRYVGESMDLLGKDRAVFLNGIAAQQRPASMLMSGVDYQLIVAIYAKHVERCMKAVLRSYQEAFDQVTAKPNDQDFTEIWNEIRQTKSACIRHSAQVLHGFKFSIPAKIKATEYLEAATGHGHDRVLQDWRVWRAQVQLHRSSQAKDTGPIPPLVTGNTAPIFPQPKPIKLQLSKLVWSWTVVGAVLGVIYGAGLAFMTSNHPIQADVSYVLGAVLFVAKLLTWEEAKQQPPTKRIIGFSFGIGAVIIVTVLSIWGNHRLNEVATPFRDVSILMECEPLMQGVNWNNTISVLELSPDPGLSHGLVLEASADGNEQRKWPSPPEAGIWNVYSCKVRNFDEAPVFGLAAEINLVFRDAIQSDPNNPASRTSGQIVASQKHDLEIPVIAGHDAFVFYIHNQTKYFVEVALPELVVAHTSGQSAKEIRLQQSDPKGKPTRFVVMPKSELPLRRNPH